MPQGNCVNKVKMTKRCHRCTIQYCIGVADIVVESLYMQCQSTESITRPIYSLYAIRDIYRIQTLANDEKSAFEKVLNMPMMR